MARPQLAKPDVKRATSLRRQMLRLIERVEDLERDVDALKGHSRKPKSRRARVEEDDEDEEEDEEEDEDEDEPSGKRRGLTILG